MQKAIASFVNVVLEMVLKIVLFLINKMYGNSYRRFYVLETIARIPYFAFLSVLHLQETFGRHPSHELMKLHFEETINEEYHLLIIEELGGGSLIIDRYFARAIGVIYYLLSCILYALFPSSAYHLMVLVEKHAYSSYDAFILQKADILKKLPPTPKSYEYYYSNSRMTIPPTHQDDLTMYEIFESIRDDESVHTKVMSECSNLESLYTNKPGIELKSTT